MTTKGLDAWVERLGKSELPVLANVVQELNELTGDDDAEVNQLADAILKDPNLTSQVLKIANSVTYNVTSYPINTVSRAIVMIGFEGVRAICIGVIMIDSLLGGNPRSRLLSQMAQAFHSAVQARALCRKTNAAVQEEVFVASLLYHLGEMAFWSSGGDTADEFDARLDKGNEDPKVIADQLLGCTFKSLTKSLAQLWKLGGTLEQALYPPKKPSEKVVAVCLGEEVSQAALEGWKSQRMTSVIGKVAHYTGQSVAETRKALEEAAEEAATFALTYGAPQICPLIPSSTQEERDEVEKTPEKPLQANHEVQLNVLRDLSNAIADRLDVNTVLQMVLEGLHRGVGLERVVLGFVQKNRVSAKFILGSGTDAWRDRFDFSCGSRSQNFFARTIESREPQWINPEMLEQSPRLCPQEITKVTGGLPCFVSGIHLRERCIAVFYADRWTLGGDLREDQFLSFRHFMIQTEMCLRSIAEQRKR